MSRYEPLTVFLKSRDHDVTSMTFQEVEAVIGRSLPPSAYEHRAWWSNNPSNNTMTRAWLAAGYKTAQVDLAGGQLTFRRIERAFAPARDEVPEDQIPEALKGLYGALRGTVWIEPGYDITQPPDPDWGGRVFGDGGDASS